MGAAQIMASCPSIRLLVSTASCLADRPLRLNDNRGRGRSGMRSSVGLGHSLVTIRSSAVRAVSATFRRRFGADPRGWPPRPRVRTPADGGVEWTVAMVPSNTRHPRYRALLERHHRDAPPEGTNRTGRSGKSSALL